MAEDGHPFHIIQEPADSMDGLWCMEQYYNELSERFEIPFDPQDPDLWKVDDMAPPDGAFLVARQNGKPIGCGGLRRFDETAGEIKRVWVLASARGLKLGSTIMDELEVLARKTGYARLLLDTNSTLTEARAMYAKRGYRDIPRYNDNPYAQCFFEKALG